MYYVVCLLNLLGEIVQLKVFLLDMDVYSPFNSFSEFIFGDRQISNVDNDLSLL